MLASVLSEVRRVLAQTHGDCEPPPGVAPPEGPRVMAQQVENGSASLMEFAPAVRDRFSRRTAAAEEALYVGCLVRQEGKPLAFGSTIGAGVIAIVLIQFFRR